ncbi:MAG: YqgE/AlgH family protein [Gemmatimonadota bacterium]
MDSLKGRLLISGGGLYDAHFRHTVVLVGEHDSRGAAGVILNRALNTTVAEAVPALADLLEAEALLFEGGPVQPEEPILLVEAIHSDFLDVPIFGPVGFLTGEVSAELRHAIVRARVYAGHAGWGAGQLEAELEADAWILDEARTEYVFTAVPDLLWTNVLRRKGPEYAALSRIPYDPSMN